MTEFEARMVKLQAERNRQLSHLILMERVVVIVVIIAMIALAVGLAI